MTHSLPLGILALCATALLAGCTATASTSPAAIDKQSTTTPTSSRAGTPSSTPTESASQAASSPETAATTTVMATRTVTAKPTGKGTVRVSATELAFVSPSGRIACLMSANYTECEYELADKTWTAPIVAGCSSGRALQVEYEIATGQCSGSPLMWDAVLDEYSMQAVGWRAGGSPATRPSWPKARGLPHFHTARLLLIGVGPPMAACAVGSSTGPSATERMSPMATSASASRMGPGMGPRPIDVRTALDVAAFVTPSGQIVCMLGADGVRCDYFAEDKTWDASRPGNCDIDWGSSLHVDRTAGTSCVGDSIVAKAALDSGLDSWRKAGDPIVPWNGMTLVAHPYASRTGSSSG